ncbi:MAG: sporulation protein [Lachnospiraceae bacterium]|nr:sporulation protein [Lachnospiraceae bacterium]
MSRWAVAGIRAVAICLLMPWMMLTAAAAEREEPDFGLWEERMAGEWEGIDHFLEGRASDGGMEVSFSGLAKALAAGEWQKAGEMAVGGLKQSLLQEVSRGGRLAGELLALGLIGAVFANFSHIFAEGQISETAFFMTYLLVFTVLASSFTDSMAIVGSVLTHQVEFMKVLVPCYFPVVAWAGGSASSVAWMEFLLLLIAAVQWLYLRLILPVTRVYILLVLAGNIVREDMLTRLTELLRSLACWGSRSLLGLVLGFQLIQGMVLPYADSLQMAGINRLLQVIPGIGDGAGAVTKMVLGTGVLVKNSMGAAAVVVLVVLSAVPLLKLAILLILYRSVAGILQPVGDKRLVACISSVAEGQRMLLGLAASGLLLFAATIALVCLGTNGVYLGA